MEIRDCEFSHTAMTGLLISDSSEVVVERNVFKDIGIITLSLVSIIMYVLILKDIMEY